MNHKSNNRRKVIIDDRIPMIKEQKNRKTNRMFVLLAVLFFMILIIALYVQSPYSKLSHVQWSGHDILQENDLAEHAELQSGMSYFNFTTTQIETNLKNMPEIKQAKVKRILPNHLEVEIKEFKMVAFWLDDDDLYPVLSTGDILFHRPWNEFRIMQPIFTHWPHKEGLIELSSELEKLKVSVSQKISEISSTPTSTDPYRLTLYMDDGYEVRTSIRHFADNMNLYFKAVDQAQAEGRTEGILYLFDGDGGWLSSPEPNKIDGNEEAIDDSDEE